MPSTKVVHAACPHDCPDACGVLITVDQLSGKATKIQGDPAHPVTRGFLCAKVAKYLDRVYSPDRVLYPMRRVAPKGSGGPGAFARIPWDEALREVAAKLQQVARDFGPEAILPYSYGGTLGALGNASMDRRFFHRLGASQLDRTICATAGGDAIVSLLGKKLGTEPEQFAHSKLILAWGANIHGTSVHLWPFIEDARRQGAKLVVIDPYQTRTAKCADWYIPIHPGTDVALALGMLHVIITEDLYDKDYVARATVGFEQLRERVREYPPEKVAQWTGVPAEDIRKLARDYAGARPAAIRVNYGVQRAENGGAAMRAIAMLPVVTGSFQHAGGGICLSTSGAYGLDEAALTRPDLMQAALGRPARVLNMSELGRVLLDLNDPPVQALFVYNSNPAAIAPDHNRVIRGLRRPDLFTVVHEQFFTDTTDYADVVLPATTFFEHKDIQTSYGHYYLGMSNQAIAPLGEARSNVELFRALAKAMGFPEPCFDETVDAMLDAALAGGSPTLQGITRERLEAEGHIRLHLNGSSRPTAADRGPTAFFLPFAAGQFPTPSGKAELYSAALAAQGIDPIASFVPPRESRHTEAAKKYPLELLGRKADNYLNSTFSNLPSVQEMEEDGLLEIHSADAAARGIAEGAAVRVFNDRGAITLKARVNGSVPRGVVAARLKWAKLSPEKQNINVLTSERLTDIGRGATFYSCLVEVAPAK
ncbi:MAG TPA: molybdopterin-dependent oxidoreductase [Terriglobales bacterium]|nr:molybdopterin-dependent oxidoreductase [Terriglobales bacterium]